MNSAKKAVVVLAAAGVVVGSSVGAASANDDHKGRDGHHGAGAHGVAKGSPGIVSGNVIQVPIDIPLNVCGNTIDILLGILNPTFGNTCVNA
ncbi:chaplin [Streptomyces syringium]|uniref:chaplin n=1 Tax=Streptomyces syringium TaxID=76729 RepID=UPI0034452C19